MVQKKEVTDAEEPLAGSNTNGSDEKQLLNNLVRCWKSYRFRGLEVRHKMGGLLNGYLGSPTKRQPLGESVLKKAAQRLSISESELSRMRWLAHLFGDVESLKNEQPECHSWTDFKRLLPQLKPNNGSKAAVRGAARSQHPLRGVVKSIDRLVVRFSHLDEIPGVERCKKLLEELMLAVKACEDRTKVQVTTERDGTEAKASEPVAAVPV